MRNEKITRVILDCNFIPFIVLLTFMTLRHLIKITTYLLTLLSTDPNPVPGCDVHVQCCPRCSQRSNSEPRPRRANYVRLHGIGQLPLNYYVLC